MSWMTFPECSNCTHDNGFDIVYTMACFLAGHQQLRIWIGEEE